MGGLIVGIILICIGVTALTGIPLFGFFFAIELIVRPLEIFLQASIDKFFSRVET